MGFSMGKEKNENAEKGKKRKREKPNKRKRVKRVPEPGHIGYHQRIFNSKEFQDIKKELEKRNKKDKVGCWSSGTYKAPEGKQREVVIQAEEKKVKKKPNVEETQENEETDVKVKRDKNSH